MNLIKFRANQEVGRKVEQVRNHQVSYPEFKKLMHRKFLFFIEQY